MSRQLHNLRRQIKRTEKEQRPWIGIMGDGNGVVNVPGRPGFVYVRPKGGSLPMIVRGGAAPKTQGIEVWVGRDVYRNRVIQVLGQHYIAGSSTSETGNVEAHAASHAIDGSDPVYISTTQITNGLVYAIDGTLNVGVYRGWIVVDGQAVQITATTLDLTASVPATGARYSLIRADSAGALSILDGTAVASLADLTSASIPASGHGYAALAAVKLYEGQTFLSRMTNAPDVTDLRFAPRADVKFVDLRQWYPFWFGPTTGLSVVIRTGTIYDGAEWAASTEHTVDLTSDVPGTASQSCYVLFTADDSADIIKTVGASVASPPNYHDIPAAPSGTRYVISAVRLDNGQTAIDEGDIVDLRFPGRHWHTADEGGGINAGILLYDVSTLHVTNYPQTYQGMVDALGYAESGDTILFNCTINGDVTIPAGVILAGDTIWNARINGWVKAYGGAHLENLTVMETGDGAVTAVEVLDNDAEVQIINCSISAISTTPGGAATTIKVTEDGSSVKIDGSYLRASTDLVGGAAVNILFDGGTTSAVDALYCIFDNYDLSTLSGTYAIRSGTGTLNLYGCVWTPTASTTGLTYRTGDRAKVDHTHAGGSGHTIQDDGSDMTARSNLNFTGTGVTVTDDSGNNATIVTIATPDHNSTGSLQGGAANEYYHLTAAQEAKIDTLAGGLNNPYWIIDGALVVTTNAAGKWLATKNYTIEAVYILGTTLGTANSTTVDVNKNGTSIFTTQANRPSLAYNDANGWAKSGTPDVVSLVEGDILSIDIDAIATGAIGLTVVVVMTWTISTIDYYQITWAGSTSTVGVDQNRNTTSSYTTQSAIFRVCRPIKITQLLIDIRNNATYTLTVEDNGTTIHTFPNVVVSSAPSADTVFTPSADIVLQPGLYKFVLTANSSLTWSDYNSSLPYYAGAFEIPTMYYGATAYTTYTPPWKITYYDSTWVPA